MTWYPFLDWLGLILVLGLVLGLVLDKPTSLYEKIGIFFNLLLISKTLGWLQYFRCYSDVRYLSLSLWLHFRKIYYSSETKWSSKVVFSLLSARVILLLIFRLSEKKGCIFFQKCLFSLILVGLRLWKYFSALFCNVCCSNSFAF